MLPPARAIQRIRVGQVLKMPVNGVKRTCFVDAIYPFFVKAYYVSKGRTVDVIFNLGELVMAGYEPKGAVL